MKYPWSFSNSPLDRSLWIIINIIDRVDIDNIIGHYNNNQQKQAKMVIISSIRLMIICIYINGY